MLQRMLDRAGMTPGMLANELGVSANSVRRWLEGVTPRLNHALAVASVFDEDGPELLDHWGYGESIPALDRERTTHDPNVANGWRLDTLIAEQRKTNKILNRIEQHLAPKRPMPEESNE